MVPKIYKILFLMLLIVPIISSCKDKKKSTAEKIVKAWVGKEVKFPNDVPCQILGQDTLCSEFYNKPFKIFVYADSAGCTSCKFKVHVWKKIITELDSIAPDQVGFLFYFQPKNEKDLNLMLKRDGFGYPVFIDRENKMNNINRFPQDIMFQSFLLDRDNAVLLIGNPSINLTIWNLYKQIITGEKGCNMTEPITSIRFEKPVIEVKDLSFKKNNRTIFTLENIGENPLVIHDIKSSCGCTIPQWGKEPTKPGGKIFISIDIKPEEVGYFNKTVDVYCNIKEKVIRVIIQGNVK